MTVLSGVRVWLKTSVSPNLTDAQVVVGPLPESTVRPALPYLVVTEIAPGQRVGEDERQFSLGGGGAPVVTPRGQRVSSVSIQGYGPETFGWLQEAELSLVRDDIRRAIRDEGVSVQLEQSVQRLDQALGTGFEARYSMVAQVGYTATTSLTESPVEATTIEVDYSASNDGGGDAYEQTVTVNL